MKEYTLEELGTDMRWVKKILGNHLQHHEVEAKAKRQQMMALLLCLLASVVSLVIALV